METLFGMTGKGFVLMAADTNAGRSIMVFKQDEDKIHVLDDSKMLGAVGEPADRASYVEWLKANMKLYALDSGFGMGTHATANYIRSSMAANLRKRMTQANFLLAGVDEDGPGLYFTDYLATMHKMPFACHGHGAAFILSIFDREWKEGMNVEQAKGVVEKCIAELHTRFLISQPKFIMKIVDKDGVRIL